MTGSGQADAMSESTPDPCPRTAWDLPASSLHDPDDVRLGNASLMIVNKSRRRLMLFDHGALRHCFRIGLGFAPSGHKQVEGDGKTPEGWYRTSDKPWSSFEGAIAIHYPNAVDAREGHRKGRISRRVRDAIVVADRERRVPPQRTELGGAILIHGGGAGRDWTLGCVALDDTDLDELRASLPRGMRTDLLVVP